VLYVQSSVGEREKQITMKNKPPPIEWHLKTEEYDLMTVPNLSLCFVVVITGRPEGKIRCVVTAVLNVLQIGHKTDSDSLPCSPQLSPMF